ncbi:MAG: hypothetical protein LIP00_06525, partial [Parabacteroides sp.]|nr:hypothetical protein [Parabacteroides sp.]
YAIKILLIFETILAAIVPLNESTVDQNRALSLVLSSNPFPSGKLSEIPIASTVLINKYFSFLPG